MLGKFIAEFTGAHQFNQMKIAKEQNIVHTDIWVKVKQSLYRPRGFQDFEPLRFQTFGTLRW